MTRTGVGTYHLSISAANRFAIYDPAGDAERISITSGGNVGIGTTNPTTFSGNRTLAINNSAGGAVLELQSNGTSALRMATSSSDSALWEPRNVPVLFATNNLERFTIHQNGNLVFKGQSTATSGESLFQNNDSALSFYSTQTSVLASKEIRFFTKVVSGEQRMTILANGNILIGTTTDNGQRLQVNGDIYAEKQSGNASLFIKRVSLDTKFEISVQETRTRIRTWQTANDRDLYFDSDQAGTTRMIIAGGGNVLIGTQTDSGDKLRVNGTTFSNDIMTWNPQNDNRSGVAWRLGAATIGAVTPNRRLRVNVGGMEYFIGAVEV
jgi:hypothetical protein